VYFVPTVTKEVIGITLLRFVRRFNGLVV
jgi:hypothetical protein